MSDVHEPAGAEIDERRDAYYRETMEKRLETAIASTVVLFGEAEAAGVDVAAVLGRAVRQSYTQRGEPVPPVLAMMLPG